MITTVTMIMISPEMKKVIEIRVLVYSYDLWNVRFLEDEDKAY
jgi:hypothetical protein